MALQVVDRAIQSFGAEGVCQDTPLAQTWAGLRTLRIADVRLLPCCSTFLANVPKL
jgi:alkylation response protein AidB-like acyl-CoA dehydrogenase